MSRLVPKTRGGWLAAFLLAILLLVAAYQVGNPHSYVSEAVARLRETNSGPQRHRHQSQRRRSAQERLQSGCRTPASDLAAVADLTHLCRSRPLGANDILQKYPSSSVRVYVVWFDMLAGDTQQLVDTRVLNDPRVTNFYDPKKAIGSWYSEHMDREKGIV